jgi:dihydroxyacid dehydratase/phosphogluconate dehydratase
MAHECAITFDLFDVPEVFNRTPYTAHLKPSGRYVAKDLFEGGGVPFPMKSSWNHGFLLGDGMTVTGRSVAESKKIVVWNNQQDVVHPADCPDGNVIATDSDKGTPEVRRADWRPHAPAFASGSIWKYVEQTGPAYQGAVIHPGVVVEKSCYADI